MSDAPPPARRRERSRAARSTAAVLAPLPRPLNRWAPLEVLSSEQLERILQAAFRVLEEAGLEIRSAASSLKLIEIHEQIDREYPGKVDLTELFDFPTIAELAQHLQSKLAA